MPFLTKVGSAAARAYGLLSAAVAAVPDVYFYLVSMLLPGTGTNGAQNNTFLDSSSNNFTVTRNGNTTQGTFSPFSQTGWSNYFDGAGDYLNITVSMSITGDFTWESWGYDTGVNAFGTLMGWRVGSPWTGFLVQRTNATNVQVNINQTGGIILTQTSGTYAKNAWVHVALVRSGSTITLYVNGTSVASGTLAGTITTGTAYWIGSDNLNNVTAVQYSGWISNQRFVNGTAVYTANFTPPTAPLTPVANTSLLTCNSQSLVDTGPNNSTITVNGNTAVTANAPFAPSLSTPTSYSGWFDGTGDYLSIADNAALDMGSSDFTVELWFYPTATPTTNSLLSKRATAGAFGGFTIYFLSNLTPVLFATVNGSSWGISSTSTIPCVLNAWNHLALVRNGTNWRLYVNGSFGINATLSGTVPDNSAAFVIGAGGAEGADAISRSLISNFRVVKGTAVYTSNFTPPTAPLTAITNTSLLTCQNATFIDNSTNAFALTVNGNAQPRTLNPFGYTTTQPVAWSASVNGGAAYFDGTGDYLTVADNVALQFTARIGTIECWVYLPTALTVDFCGILDKWNGSALAGWVIDYTSGANRGRVRFMGGTMSLTSTSFVTVGSWTHIAVTLDGTNAVIYLNGVSQGSASIAGQNLSASGEILAINGDGVSTNINAIQYIAGVRVIKGTVLYPSNFAPPVAPPTAVTNTSLLLNYTNAGIYDAASQNALETVGNAQISTAQSKWGGGSMYFDGTGDYLIPSNTLPLTFGTGNFTIEVWVYAISFAGFPTILDYRPAATNGSYPLLYLDTSGAPVYYVNSTAVITGSALSTNTWYHIALCRSGTSTRLFVNGAQAGSTISDPNNYLGPASRPIIGGNGFTLGTGIFNGYMDDLRITRFARYTSNFTPPAAAFPTQ